MTLAEIINQTRILLDEPDPTDRWSDANLTALINQSQLAVALELTSFPEATYYYTGGTIPGQQEYQLPAIISVLRVYIAGQPIVPTSIAKMEGAQIELFDQTAANFQTQWRSQPEESYPVANAELGFPSSSMMPWNQAQRPKFYLRGGSLGIVPTPSSNSLFQIDVVPTPPRLVSDSTAGGQNSQQSIYPYKFLDAIVWKTAEQCYYSDKNLQQSQVARQNFELELGKLRSWHMNLAHHEPQSFIPVTYRSYFQGSEVNNNNTFRWRG